MKNILRILAVFLISYGVFSQDQKEQPSKMLDFVSKTGVIIKYEDFDLPNIKENYGFATSKIRKIIAGSEAKYFLQISKSGKYDTKTASIAFEDLIETQKAILNLKGQSENDLTTIADYMENKFITDDGFQVGYFVSKGKITWYMKLEKYGSENTVFINDYQSIETAFQLGKEKIEALKLSK